MPTFKSLFFQHEAKSTLAFALLGSALLILLTVALFENNIKATAEKQTFEELDESVINAEQVVRGKVRQYMSALKFLHATPPIKGIVRALDNNNVDPFDNTTTAQWKGRLETIFVAFIENNQEIDQLRVIEAVGEGREFIRVVRDGGSVHIAREFELQPKGGRDYYAKSIETNNGEFYTSDINLNREYGQLQYPYKAVIRLSLPIFSELGQRYGFIIVNINASYLLNEIKASLNAKQQLFITDHQGYFVAHPQSEKSFSKDLKPSVNWASEFVEPLQPGRAYLQYKPQGSPNLYSSTRALSIGASQNNAPFYIHVALPETAVLSAMNEKRIAVYSVITVVTLIFCVILAFVHRSNRKNIELAKIRGESVAIIESSQDAIFSVDPNGIVKSWNMSAETLFDIPSQIIINHPIDAFDTLEALEIGRLLGHSEKQRTHTTSFINSDNEERKLLVTGSLVWTEQSQASGVAVVIRDITDEQNAKDAIERVNAKLEEKVVSRTKELVKATEEARKASKVKSSFISNISHEMRTPLNGVVGSLSLLKRQPLNEKAEQLVSMMEISCSNLNVLINDVLDLSKIEAGKLDINHQQFSPIELVESIARAFAVKAASKGLELIVDTTGLIDGELISDPHRINQIISNLLNNACKFTHEGHILLKVAMCETTEDEYELHVVVSDTGVGIAKENHDKLFSAFTQADATVATQYGGTGLGLSICRELSKLLGGDITFSSTQGVGSTFSFFVTANHVMKLGLREALSTSSLNGLQVGISAQYEPLEESLCSLLMHYGANCSVLDSDRNTNAWKDFTLVILDETSPLLASLDDTWENLSIDTDLTELPLVCILQKIESVPMMFNHIKPVYLSKPLLTASFESIVQRLEAKLSGFDSASSHLASDNDNTASLGDDVSMRFIENTNVLIVDDNLINREVAKGVLESLPVKIFTCSDGEEVVAFLSKCEEKGKVVHCILMDCQMPKMNGYEATKAIRNGSVGPSHQEVPIIAMTANAMLGEKEKCLEAGMDDFTTKPILAEVLLPKVKQWLLHKLALMSAKNENIVPVVDNIVASVSKVGSRIQSTSDSQSENVEGECRWDKESALERIMGDKVMFQHACESFASKVPDKFKVLSKSVMKQKSSEVQVLSLKLKLMAADIGAVQLRRDFENLLELARVDDWSAAEQLIPTINDDLNTFLELLDVA